MLAVLDVLMHRYPFVMIDMIKIEGNESLTELRTFPSMNPILQVISQVTRLCWVLQSAMAQLREYCRLEGKF